MGESFTAIVFWHLEVDILFADVFVELKSNSGCVFDILVQFVQEVIEFVFFSENEFFTKFDGEIAVW